MDQIKIVGGFSDLKELLIQTFHIKDVRDEVKLYFSNRAGALIMHRYDDHLKMITLSSDMSTRNLIGFLSHRAKQLIYEAFATENPSEFLNEQFLLHGFFRS